ncbi:MAG: DUF3515 family protein [Microbacteriaceae bacterium]
MKSPTRLAAVTLLLVVTLTGCAQAVALEPAVNGEAPECADMVVHAPSDISDLPYRETNAQGTVAWGTPTSVILRCGVAVPDPTSTLPCVYVDGVYWLRDDSNSPNYVFTTYGRSPATEVIINRDVVSPGPALFDLAPSIKYTKEVTTCTEIEDSLGAPTPAP